MKNDWATVFGQERGTHERPDRHRHPDQPRRRRRSSVPARSTPGCARACPTGSRSTPPTSRTSPRCNATCAPPNSNRSTTRSRRRSPEQTSASLSYRGRRNRPRRLGRPRPRTRRHRRRAQPASARPPGQPPRRHHPIHRNRRHRRRVRDRPGEEISQSTRDWVEGFVPAQIGAGKYIAHITVGFATLDDLETIEAEPFDAFAVHPASIAVYHLGNNGTARTQLKPGRSHRRSSSRT